jgi:hypothetical protein
MWPARIVASASSAKFSWPVIRQESAHPSMSCEGRIPLAYLVRNKANPVKGSVLDINSLGR